jgi:hypothetical protein
MFAWETTGRRIFRQMPAELFPKTKALAAIPPTLKKLTSYANGGQAPQPFFAKFNHSL